MKRILWWVGLSVLALILWWAAMESAEGATGGVTDTGPGQEYFAYSTNETHVLQFVGTNVLAVIGAGTATANGTNILRDTVNGITVWTNINGQSGVAYDPGLHVFSNEGNITNGAGTLLYDASASAIVGQTWTIRGGAGPAPTVVAGTNYVTTNMTAYYPAPGIGPPGVSRGTNWYYVNAITGNDTNAIPGRPDRPYQNFTNVVFYYAVHTNDVIGLFPATNYFGEFNITVSNGVSIIGLGPRDSCWLGKAASKVGVSDVALKPAHGCTFANFAGDITIGAFAANNVTIQNVHTIGLIDNYLPAGGSNVVADSCVFECSGADSVGPLIDAAVVTSGYNIIKNTVFSVRRNGNGATTRRALVVKGGTNLITGCSFVAMDSTNNVANTFGCIGLSIEGNGYTLVSGCTALVYNTNANNVCAFTNAINASDTDVAYTMPATLVYSNGVAWWPGHVVRTNFIGGQLYTNVYSMPIYVSATISNVVANAAGATRHALWVYPQAGSAGIAGVTNFAGDYHQAMGATVAFTNMVYLGAQVMPGQVYAYTNQSSGAGNDSRVMMGQMRW